VFDVEVDPRLGPAHFKTAFDGISVFLVLLTTLLMPLTLLGTRQGRIDRARARKEKFHRVRLLVLRGRHASRRFCAPSNVFLVFYVSGTHAEPE